MTRTEDEFVSLADRSAFANRAKADFLISLHVNAASKRGAVGFETFFFAREPSDNDARASAQRENLVVESNGATGKDLESLLRTTLADMAVTRDMKESSNLAERLLASLEKILRVDNRGVKSGPFYVLATAAMPAVLVESAFITNPKEERKLQREEHRQRIADALYRGDRCLQGPLRAAAGPAERPGRRRVLTGGRTMFRRRGSLWPWLTVLAGERGGDRGNRVGRLAADDRSVTPALPRSRAPPARRPRRPSTCGCDSFSRRRPSPSWRKRSGTSRADPPCRTPCGLW